jgi:penicillin-binding protein 2
VIGVEDRTRLRIGVIALIVLAMLAVLLVRLWFLQVLAGDRFAEASLSNSVRIVRVEAPRGRILDRKGRVLVDNRTALAVGIRRDQLPTDPAVQKRILRRVARLLQISVAQIRADLADVRASPFAPVVIAREVPEEVIFAIRERRTTLFRGVESLTLPIRIYPKGKVASMILGYVGETNQEEVSRLAPDYRLGDRIGRTGIEAQYEKQLRGTPGLRKLEVDATGRVLRVLGPERPPVPGKDIQLSIDVRVQRATERAVLEGMRRARAVRFFETGEFFRAPAGAAVVLDPNTGEVIAMVSRPTYDVRRFVGGVSEKYFASLNDPKAHNPLLNRTIQTAYPPGSTIKPFFAVAALESGVGTPGGLYPCLSAWTFGDTTFRNWQPRNAQITIEQSLVESCDTVYYEFGRRWWFREQNQEAAGQEVTEVAQTWARRFGLGLPTQVDLPQEVAGRIPGRDWKREVWEANREEYCRRYVETRDVLFEDLCERGFLWRGGDAVNMSIGQGDVGATPLQMAVGYGAIANGGKVLEPHLVRAIKNPDGTIARRIEPVVVRRVKASASSLRYVQRALGAVIEYGTGASPFLGWPQSTIPVAGKTGSSELAGNQPFSLFGAYAPLNDPQYVAYAVIEEAGFVGANVVRRIMDALFARERAQIDFGTARRD